MSPTIVIGMHRSGTSLLVRVLRRLGVFAGASLDHHSEAKFFLGINRWLLRKTRSDWTRPAGIDALFAAPEVREEVVRYLRTIVRGPRSIKYLGLMRYLRHRGIADLDFPWCFKDPRSTFTLPIWREVFPEARIIHIHRNGVDVASSLAQRELRWTGRDSGRFRRWSGRMGALALTPTCIHPPFGLRAMDLDAGFELWEEYVARAVSHVEAAPSDRVLEFAFEDLVASPRDHARRLVAFLDLDAPDNRIDAAIEGIDPSRGSAHRRDDELTRFYEWKRGTPWMERLGYGGAP